MLEWEAAPHRRARPVDAGDTGKRPDQRFCALGGPGLRVGVTVPYSFSCRAMTFFWISEVPS